MPLNAQAPVSDKTEQKSSIKQDAVLTALMEKTYAEIETYFDNNQSALAHATDAEIDTYVDAIANLADAKEAIRSLAKDSQFNSYVIRKLAQVISYILKQP